MLSSALRGLGSVVPSGKRQSVSAVIMMFSGYSSRATIAIFFSRAIFLLSQ